MEKEAQFKKSLDEAIAIIKSGKNKGWDNLEMYLGEATKDILYPLTEILNVAAMEYKRGGTQKIDALSSILADYSQGKKEGIKTLIKKNDELRKISGVYKDAIYWYEELAGKAEKTNANRNAASSSPASHLHTDCIPQLWEVEQLHEYIGTKEGMKTKGYVESLKRCSGDLYAHKRKKILDTLDSTITGIDYK